MTRLYGYAGKILRVHLTRGTIEELPLAEEMARNYLGGLGFAARILFDELGPGVDPLGPDNPLLLCPGLFCGTPASVGNRSELAAKSPLTGVLGYSAFSGSMGSALKRAGFDALIVDGRSQQPVYLWIHDHQVEIRDASAAWGKDVGAAEDAILEQVGKASLVTIGPAGENRVRFAAAIADSSRAAGRSGMGAVMGSKNLKAIAAKGSTNIVVADREGLVALNRRLTNEYQENESLGLLSRYGTWVGLIGLRRNGILPSKNFQLGTHPDDGAIDQDAMVQATLDHRETCANCPIRCRPAVKPGMQWALDVRYGGPQYETVAGMGSLLMNYNPAAIAKAHELCNRLGMDTISAGCAIAWAMECSERGVSLGRHLRWGDTQAIFELLGDIAYRRGLGALLADGTREAARRVGQGSDAWTLEVKGLEFGMHDPRGKKGQGLAYGTCPRGACHMNAIHDESFQAQNPFPDLGFEQPMSRVSIEGKAKLVKVTQDYWGTLCDTVGICKFPANAWRPYKAALMAEYIRLVTGWDTNVDEMLLTGERIFNLARMFNVREGVRRQDDCLPPRMAEPLPDGPTAGERISQADMDRMLDEYYALRGWDQGGVPTPETLARLGLVESH